MDLRLRHKKPNTISDRLSCVNCVFRKKEKKNYDFFIYFCQVSLCAFMATKKKRKPSAYNRHVGREMRRGLTMAQAAKSWNRGKPKTTKAKKAKTRKRSYKSKVRKTVKRRNGISLLGGLGPKGLLAGIMGMAFLPRFLPALPAGGAEMATGLALSTMGLGGGAALKQVGAMRLIGSQIMPLLGGFGGGGNGNGRYDY